MKLGELLNLIQAHQKAKERLAMQSHLYMQMPAGPPKTRRYEHLQTIEQEILDLLDTDIS